MALLPVEEALARVLDGVTPLPGRLTPLTDGHGRVLAEDLRALRTQPPADVSAMDGYAVRAADVVSVPQTLQIVGEVAAGHVLDRAIGPSQAARIFTGGVVPDGADAVVIQEVTIREGNAVTIRASVPAGKNVRKAGLDFRAGDVLLQSGRRLTARDLSLAAAMNHAGVPVHVRPRVAILATGDELVSPGEPVGVGQIVHSNGYALAALARAEGADVLDLGIARDTMSETQDAVRRARAEAADILVTTGGASVGEHDLVQAALLAEGAEMMFWKVAIRPGKPMMHGTLRSMRILGLPGNPVSAFVCGFLFLVPLIRRLAGRRDGRHRPESGVLGCALPPNDERTDFLRAALSADAHGARVVTPLAPQDSSILTVLARADALLIRPAHAPAAAAGDACELLLLDD